MRNELRLKLIEISSIPIITVGVLFLIFVNYIISRNIENDFKDRMDIAAEYVNSAMNDSINNEKDKLMIIASDRDLNMMFKYGVKVKNSSNYYYDSEDINTGDKTIIYKKMNKNIDYLSVINIIKKTLYKEPRMQEVSLEFFDKNGTNIISSYSQEMSYGNAPINRELNAVLNKDSVFKKKRIVTDIVEYNKKFYFKVGIPVPERTLDYIPEGAVVLTYPIDKTVLDRVKGAFDGDIVLLDMEGTVVDRTDFGGIDVNYKLHLKDLEAGKKITVKKNGKTFMVKGSPLVDSKNSTIGMLLIVADKSEIEDLKLFSFFIILIVIIILVIGVLTISVYESKKIVKPINKFLEHINKIKEGSYDQLENIDLISEIDVIRESFNKLVEKSHLSMEEVKRRDETLVMMNKELLAIIKEKERMYQLSITDGLTGVYNHKYFQEMLFAEVERAIKYELSVSLVMIDIDHFKKVNDTFGHQTGDEILLGVAAKIRDLIREGDTVSRYGGEEFAIILPNTTQEGAFIFAERVRKVIESSDFNSKKISVSCGISSYPEDFKDEENSDKTSNDIKNDLIKKADIALYFSKNTGRNRSTRFEKYLEIKKKIIFDQCGRE